MVRRDGSASGALREAARITQSVTPDHTARFALELMGALGSDVLPVLSQGQFSGYVSRKDAMMSPHHLVRDLLKSTTTRLDADQPVLEAIRTLISNCIPAASVEEEGRFLGLVTPFLLLEHISISRDPLTGLPWSDRLREWGAEQLLNGHEITILFFDLNDFGRYNKLYGHIFGDRVLQAFSARLNTVFSPETDVLVRYGGDEFVLATLRVREEAEEMMIRVAETPVFAEGLSEPVSFSVGIAGGKRTKERSSVHSAATLDNLINLASRDCLARKQQSKPGAASVGGEKGEESMAEALSAASSSLRLARPGAELNLQDAILRLNKNGERFLTLTGKVTEGGEARPLAVTRRIDSGLRNAAIEAVQRSLEPAAGPGSVS